jgi:hypothetical protein
MFFQSFLSFFSDFISPRYPILNTGRRQIMALDPDRIALAKKFVLRRKNWLQGGGRVSTEYFAIYVSNSKKKSFKMGHREPVR